VTAMHFAILIPDWGSLDSVRSAHSELELAAIILFGLLALFDILAHFAEDDKGRERILERIGLCCFGLAIIAEIAGYVYGQRNDLLSEQVISSLDQETKDAGQRMAVLETRAGGLDTRLGITTKQVGSLEYQFPAAKAKIADLGSRASDAIARTSRLEAQLSWRTVTSEQAITLANSLSRIFPGKLMPLSGVTIQFSYPMNSEEAAEYADELVVCLKQIVDY